MPSPTRITSRSNARIAHVRKVREGRVTGEIFLEGVRLGEEVLRSGLKLIDCLFSSEATDNERIVGIVRELEQRGIPTAEVSAGLLKTLADTVTPQGIFIVCERPGNGKTQIEAALKSERSGIVLCLINVADPANLGAIFRTAEAAGAVGLITSIGSADAFSPKVNRGALGANLRMPVWQGAETGEILRWAKFNGLRSRAADIGGEVSYTNVDWAVPSLVVFGSEAHGLERMILDDMDEVFIIPMKNGVESLNLSVSAGIVLFEASQQNSA